jgi:hypothetical protein
MRTCKFVSGGMYRWLNTLVFAIPILLIGVIPAFCYGQAGEEELFFGAEDIANWKSSIAAGQAELTDDGLALVSGAGGWGGGVSSPWLTVDFAKSPVIVIKVAGVSNNWVLKLGLNQDDSAWGPYIQGDTGITGEFTYNLPGDLNSFPDGVEPPDPEGVSDVQIRIWGVGDGTAKVSVESIRIFYEDDPDDRPRFVDPELEKAYGQSSSVEAYGKLITLWAVMKQK